MSHRKQKHKHENNGKGRTESPWLQDSFTSSNVRGVKPFEHKTLKKFPTLTADFEKKFRIL